MKKKFTLESITPQKLSDRLYDKIIKEDILLLLKDKKFFIKKSCPACSSRKYEFFLKKNNFEYQECKKCRTFYMSPRPTEKVLSNFYRNSKTYDFYNKYIFPAGEKSRYININVPIVKKIKIIIKKKNKKLKILDVGAGYGTFCKAAANSTFFDEVYALEPTPSGAVNCKGKKIIPINLSFDNFYKKNQIMFDVVTFFEVIEHLFDPNIFLKKIYKMLNRNGLIAFTCPNGEGFDVQLLKERSDTIDHEHLNYFNLDSIKILLKKNNFEIIEISTPGKLDVDIVKSKISQKKNNVELNKFYKKIFFDQKISDNFQKFITDNYLSSNMWIVAKKKS